MTGSLKAATLSLAVLAAAALAASAAESRTWTTAAGIRFTMSDRALAAARDGREIFSTTALLAEKRREFDADVEERARELLAPDPPEYGEPIADATISYRPLSVVGPLVSLEVAGGGYSPGAAHPYGFQIIEVIDVTRPDAKPSLLDYYEERALVEALAADPWIRRVGAAAEAPLPRTSLSALAAALNDASPGAEEGDVGCSLDAFFSVRLVHSFAFHHRAGDKVAVRIGIPYAHEVCRGEMHEVGLLLPIPAALRAELARADKREAGFLAKDAPAAPPYQEKFEADLRDVARRLKAR